MTGSYFEDVPLEHVEETPGLTITSAHVAIYLGLTRELADDGGAVPDVLPLCFTTGLGWRGPKPPLGVLAFLGLDRPVPCSRPVRATHTYRAAGGTPIEFNSITVTDGIAMGTEGMKASLISRETVADSVELVVRGHLMDGFVGISGCDKTIPAMVMAMARLNLPSVMLYGGSILYGEYKGRRLTIQDVFEAIGAFNAGKINAQELGAIEGRACPGGGACGGQFTANTMATAFEMLGVSPMGVNDVPAMDPRKEEIAFETGKLVMDVLKRGVLPRQIITKRALQNAIAGVMATGGSTNAVLHLLAVAKEAGVKLTIDEFDTVSRRTPLLADLKPWGSYTAPEMYEAGGMAVVAKRLLDAGLLNATEMTVTGRTIGDEARAARETPGQKVIRPLANPIARHGGIAILRGNLAPEGCVAKVAGHAEEVFRGAARVFEREEDAFVAGKAGQSKGGGLFLVPRRGAPGGGGGWGGRARWGGPPGARAGAGGAPPTPRRRSR